MNNRQMVQIDVKQTLHETSNRGVEFIVRKIVASRGTLITDVSVVGYDNAGVPQSCTYLLADAPEKIRDLVNNAFQCAFGGK